MNQSDGNENFLTCSFCGKSQKEVKKLVAGPSVYICEECVALCGEIVEAKSCEEIPFASSKGKSLTPMQIKSFLDQHVIGQEKAKKVLSVAVHNHYKRINSQVDTSDVEIQKSNILLVGPTGTGKTLLAQTLAKVLNVPFTIADATGLTEAGYVGEDVESIIASLLNAANGDIELAQKGIIYVDEVDKITRRGENQSITRDVSGEGVQQALLKIIEGTVCNTPVRGGRKHPNQETVKVDTSQILFICGGAFSGIEDIIFGRLGKKSLGFNEMAKDKPTEEVKLKKEQAMRHLTSQDLLKYGLIPEFIGRLPSIAVLDPLSREDLIRVLKEPHFSIVKQYEHLLSLDGVKLVFTDKALEAVAEEVMKKKTGARGLRTVFEEAMMDIMYDVPQNKNIQQVVFNERSILKKELPLIVVDKKKPNNNS